MILTCPNCETQYFADDSTIGESGRSVKCAACDNTWFVDPKGEALAAGRVTGGAHEAYREKVRARREKASRSVAVIAWVVVGSVFAGILAGGLLFRDRVVEVWPQSASAFDAIGLEVNRFGMTFTETEAERFLEGTTPVLEITGEVKNVTGSVRTAPLIRVVMLDEKGVEIGESFATVSPDNIAAGDTGKFVTRVENPPYEAFELELQLAAPGSGTPGDVRSIADAGEAG
ncbi:MJ0042-type zinc finger domain-containing protein [Henriciella litoralis]|uniref:MJ0042-type zinc finger domain-containing protein n=1 Tax=Henriciella litoralis TaxID=568102 RepID=UPI0009FBB366|nr:MJ0042-type zinc finger domain-containing protein [Henriciella litoralis]